MSMTSGDVDLVRTASAFDEEWYLWRYPDVAKTGLDPAEHFLRYGALMGRDPGPDFSTSAYLSANPDVAAAGLNPLLHYVKHGQAEGRRVLPLETWRDDTTPAPVAKVARLRERLLTLGFTEQPLMDLGEIATSDPDPKARTQASMELAQWRMRRAGEADFYTALDHLSAAAHDAGECAADAAFMARLATLEILCNFHSGNRDAALQARRRAVFERALTPDVLLAWSNFEDLDGMRVRWINAALGVTGVEPIALTCDDGRPAYDRLTVNGDPATVSEGPKVSVLVAAYRAASTLPTALRSLQAQSWRNLEIIVIDDASPGPETRAVAERFAAADPRVRVLSMTRNGGAYVARNHGLDAATGDYVTLHDADDWAHPRRIETQVRFLEANPGVLGCTSQQARATPDLRFLRWTGGGAFTIRNTSSFLFRRAPMRADFGYWDVVRVSADSELIRRIQAKLGLGSVRHLDTGPLAFQRDTGGSAVASGPLAINGFAYGARKLYRDAQRHVHHAGGLRYLGDPARTAFPVPRLMRVRTDDGTRHFPVILGSEFRMQGGSVRSCVEELRCARTHGIRTGVFEMFRYDLGDGAGTHMKSIVRDEIDGETVELLCYGESVSCDLLMIRYPPVLQHLQRYLPRIRANRIAVIANQTPMSDYGPDGVLRYDPAQCARVLAQQFEGEATWYPIGPLIRDVLTTRHPEALSAITLSDEDWHNILDPSAWARPPHRPAADGRIRIGRHARDSPVKWPASVHGLKAVYPDAPDVEIHVLGGADTPSALLGGLPANWRVTPFGGQSPQGFLSGLDVFVYFTHPDWVESFGRAILEAMATGVPVVLPAVYRPLFGDAAVYATEETAIDAARRLCQDRALYETQVRRGHDLVTTRFSPAAHLERLARAGVCMDAVGAAVSTGASRQRPA